MINQDVKDQNIVEKYEEKIMTEKQEKKFQIVKSLWDSLHKYLVYAIITLLIGVYAGITASKIYYKSKMEESILLGGFVFEKKGYNIIPK